jgi:hypothetical protein
VNTKCDLHCSARLQDVRLAAIGPGRYREQHAYHYQRK